MRRFRYPDSGSWRDRGGAHGEAFAGEIRSLAELRLYLTREVGGFRSDDDVIALAARHLPVLEAYDRALFDELVGIAEGAGTTAEMIAVLNHYTDLRDLGSVDDPGVIGADGCTALWARTAAGPVVAQTWDMHATAMPYVIALEVPGVEERPATVLLSLTGCLGMAGLSARGVAVSINNLHSTDARIGVIWSALVRKALAAPDAAAARDAIVSAPVGSGHHYMVADPGAAYGIETSGTLREVIFDAAAGGDLYVHTNHCLDGAVAACSRVPSGSTTYARLERAKSDAERRPIAGVEDAFSRLGSEEGYPESVCTNMASAARPHAAATCGAVAIDVTERRMLACAGFPHHATPAVFELP